MKKIFLSTIFITISVFGQWNLKWTGPNTYYNFTGGFLNFQKSSNTWLQRYYTVDSLKMQIMTGHYSSTPQYTYTFSSDEVLAGGQIYSLGLDLTGDQITEFYTVGYVGTSTNYRQTFRIIDIVKNIILFQKSDATSSYYYSTFYDLDNDGYYECLLAKYPYPSLLNYNFEVYQTGISTNMNSEIIPQKLNFKVSQNFPNPFNPDTKINFSILSKSEVKIKIFDLKGQLINTILDEIKSPGDYEITWNGNNLNGGKVSSGIYFYEVIADKQSQVKKMMLIR